jgi:hypothetical protein
MKIIYDTDQPPQKRLAFIERDGTEPYYGFRCFQINLDDGEELATIGVWGNAKKRQEILAAIKAKEKENNA